MRDGAGLQERVAIGVALGILGSVVFWWQRSSGRWWHRISSIWRSGQQLLQLMLIVPEEEQIKPQRVVFSPEEYPGTLPSEADVRKAEGLRQQGNTAYAEGSYEEAIAIYSHAVLLNPVDHLSYSNRSACWVQANRPMEAFDDADLCVRLAPSFVKGYLRKGAAEQLLRRGVDAHASYKKGLSIEPENEKLQNAMNTLRSNSNSGVQAALHHVLFVSPHLQMDRLFQALEDPDRLTASYVEKHKTQLDAQFECLVQTLHVDLSLLVASSVLRDAYDRVTFACGQLLQWAPEAVSKHMAVAPRIVAGLGLAVRCGWSIHHGVAKFSANALTILATSEGAEDSLRREAVRLLLGGLVRWLVDPVPEPENPPEDRDVCGCTFLSARLSAATWLERLFEHGTKAWVREECERFPDIVLLTIHLCLIVRDERAVPLGLPCLLRLPKVAKAVMDAELVIDLSTCSRDSAGRKDGKRWARQKGRGAAQPVLASAPSVAEPAATGIPSYEPVATVAAARCEGVALQRTPSACAEGCETSDADVKMETEVHESKAPRLTAPMQRVGEWMMTSLGYLLVFIDDDALFAAHACSALHRLAAAVPDGVSRLADGVWVGLPMLERLSSLACQHSAALELLEALSRHSQSSRIAMCSLAAVLAGVEADASLPSTSVASIDTLAFPADVEMSTAPSASSTSPAADVQDPQHGHAQDMRAEALPRAEHGERSNAHESLEDAGEPSWVECYHELHDELWVKRPCSMPSGERGDLPALLPAAADATLSLVVLGNFERVASQVPVAARLSLLRPAALGGELIVEVPGVPAGWNPRSADKMTGRLSLDTHNALGSAEWKTGKAGTVVVLLRSAIQRTPSTPDWSAAVWLCHDAGALGAIIINDLLDDGPMQPAFRMGLFGSPAPPVVAFMISGRDAKHLWDASHRYGEDPAGVEVTVQSVRSSSSSSSSSGPPELSAIPPWPLVLRMAQDVAQAWSLIETVHRAVPSEELARRLAHLAERMGLPEKRVWLTRRLQRNHRGDTDSDEPEETHLAFVECDRQGNQLLQLRRQLAERTGICAPDIVGEFEVRFKDESSVGSAVVREWMDILAQQAFLPAAHHLLVSLDHGKTFLPDPAAPFINRHWVGDFELLGRLIGLALWQQVTLDLPLHPYVCKLLLQFDEVFTKKEHLFEEDIAELKRLDPDICRHKIQWLLSNDISTLGYEMPFADLLCACVEGTAGMESDTSLPLLEEVVTQSSTLPGDEQAVEPPRLRFFKQTQVLLARADEESTVTEANKMEFVRALLQWRLRDSLRGPVSAIMRGVHAAVPPEVLAEARRMLTADELCALLAGSRDINVDDWQRNTRTVGGLTANSQEVVWFWQTLRSWATDGRKHLLQNFLQFATGSRRVPVGGFAQLVGFNGGRHLFTLAKGVHLSLGSLPNSHACICTVDLPPWESAEAAAHKLLAAAEAGHTRFDEGMVQPE